MRSQTARPECAHGVRLIIYHTERHSREYSDRGFFWNLPALTQAGRKADVSGHAASVCARPCGTDGTAWSRGMEPVHRRVEPVEPIQFKEYTLLISFKLYRLHWFHTPVHRFHASAPSGSIGSTRLRTNSHQSTSAPHGRVLEMSHGQSSTATLDPESAERVEPVACEAQRSSGRAWDSELACEVALAFLRILGEIRTREDRNKNAFGVECVPEVVGQRCSTRHWKIAPAFAEDLSSKRYVYSVDVPSYWSP